MELKEIKAAAENAVEQFKESETGKAIFGEDGKFDKEDIDRFSKDIKDSNVGKAVFGEDGKFDKEDVQRLSEGAKSAVKDVAEKIKGILGE